MLSASLNKTLPSFITWHVFNTSENALRGNIEVLRAFVQGFVHRHDNVPGGEAARLPGVVRLGERVGQQVGGVPPLHVLDSLLRARLTELIHSPVHCIAVTTANKFLKNNIIKRAHSELFFFLFFLEWYIAH